MCPPPMEGDRFPPPPMPEYLRETLVLFSLSGGKLFLGDEICLDGVAPPWLFAGIPKKGLSPPIAVKSHK